MTEGGVWILSGPRTGSYLLCELLNTAGLDPPLAERYHPKFTAPFGIERYPKNNKVHPNHMRHYRVTLEEVAEQIPDNRYVLLRRNDLIAVAVSLHIAEHTHVWEATNSCIANDFRKISVPIDPLRLLQKYRKAQADDEHWVRALDRLGLGYCEITYESLVTHPIATLDRVGRHCGLHINLESAMEAVTHQVQRRIRPGLYEACYDALNHGIGTMANGPESTQ